MTKKMAKEIDAAKARTKAAPLAGTRASVPAEVLLEKADREMATPARRACTCAKRGDIRTCPVHGATAPAPLSRVAYVPVRLAASGREYLHALALFNSREAAQNHITERQRIDARPLAQGLVDSYVRVAKIEMREIEEEKT